MSHIKVGLQEWVSREDYVSLFDRRVSTLSAQERNAIYDVFKDYKKMKTKHCEYDLPDLVMNLHFRLNNENLQGEKMDFVYVDENFRTHFGLLKLAQSVIDLLSHFFPQSFDVLPPETSFINGEPPIVIEPGSNENAIITVFGGSGNVDTKMVGFGAEQVILVRDDSVKKEISNYIGHQALIPTIVECKGLEFQVAHSSVCTKKNSLIESFPDWAEKKRGEFFLFCPVGKEALFPESENRASLLHQLGICKMHNIVAS
ncbi:Uncharacterized protein Adt_03916 [Abeliophyllum distichum]|uniref:Uncharacterized protein n=1 Tax=Abeliophyllum distichum TaxID=126358 RepID=A0ABD1VZV6_9LAMI